MPDFTTHHLIAEEVLRALPPNSLIAKDIRANENVFFWGCQGPDLLYFYRIWQPSRKVASLGSKFHKFSGETLIKTALDYVETHKDEADYTILRTYVAGLICHHAVDSILHPYIYFIQEQIRRDVKTPPIIIHATLERDLDTILHYLYYFTPVSYLKFRSQYTTRHNLPKAIWGLYNYLAKTLLNTEIKPKVIDECFRQSQVVNRLLYPANAAANWSSAKFMVFATKRSPYMSEKLEKYQLKKANIEILNNSNKPWYNVNVPEINYDYSIWELMEQARKQTITILGDDLSYENIATLKENFHAGKPQK